MKSNRLFALLGLTFGVFAQQAARPARDPLLDLKSSPHSFKARGKLTRSERTYKKGFKEFMFEHEGSSISFWAATKKKADKLFKQYVYEQQNSRDKG